LLKINRRLKNAKYVQSMKQARENTLGGSLKSRATNMTKEMSEAQSRIFSEYSKNGLTFRHP